MMDSLQVSVVIPVFNEELVLHEFYPRLKKEAKVGVNRTSCCLWTMAVRIIHSN